MFSFGSGVKKDQGTGFSVLAEPEMKREPKMKEGGGGGEGRKHFILSSPPPLRSFTRAIFRAVSDSRSLFFNPEPQGNACYAS